MADAARHPVGAHNDLALRTIVPQLTRQQIGGTLLSAGFESRPGARQIMASGEIAKQKGLALDPGAVDIAEAANTMGHGGSD